MSHHTEKTQKTRNLSQYLFFSLAAAILLFFLTAASTYGVTTVGNNVSVGGTLTATGAVTFNGNTTIGDASTDTLTLTARISSAIFASSTFQIGNAAGDEELTVDNDAVSVGSVTNSTTLSVYSNLAITGHIVPEASHNNLYNLGTYGRAWGSIFASGTILTNNLAVNGSVVSNFKPVGNNFFDLGAYGTAWNEIFASGTIYASAITQFNGSGSSTLYLDTDDTVTTAGPQIIFRDATSTACTAIWTDAGELLTSVVTCP